METFLAGLRPVLAWEGDTAQGDSITPADSFLLSGVGKGDSFLPGEESFLIGCTDSAGEAEDGEVREEEEDTERGETPVEEGLSQGAGVEEEVLGRGVEVIEEEGAGTGEKEGGLYGLGPELGKEGLMVVGVCLGVRGEEEGSL